MIITVVSKSSCPVSVEIKNYSLHKTQSYGGTLKVIPLLEIFHFIIDPGQLYASCKFWIYDHVASFFRLIKKKEKIQPQGRKW